MYFKFKNILKRAIVLCILHLFITQNLKAQLLSTGSAFTHADTLRGSNTPERAWWNVIHYEITVQPDFLSKTISGICSIKFKTLSKKHPGIVQIDLQQPMEMDSIIINDRSSAFIREGEVFHVQMPKIKTSKAVYKMTCFYHGQPKEAVKPPWDGGWIWKKDLNGNPWMSVACQGLGASVWYPCKDIQSDEPDSGAILHVIVPDSLVAIGNGRMIGKNKLENGNTMYSWQVTAPINNYCIIPYIGKYVHFSEIYKGEKGNLDMDYWVLSYNLEKAKKQFTDAPRMMKAFEYWFGPYPFYEDGYKLVEAPHLGMEHQSATAYGNGFQNGYKGRDLSGSGWGMKWDFIIVHESGHEWFANSITTNDIADMWVHESFTNYSETLFTDYYYGPEAGNAYVIGTRKNIENDIPITGPYNVNKEGSGDMYYKGGNMLHAIRQIISDDEKFRQLLRGLNKTFYHQTVTAAQIKDYINKQSGHDFSKLFEQYLNTTKVPELDYRINDKSISFKWNTDSVVAGFNMPVKISFGKAEVWIKPAGDWQTLSPGEGYDGKTFLVNENFYIHAKKME